MDILRAFPPLVLLLTGGVLGFLLCLALGPVRDAWDNFLYRMEDAARVVGWVVLALIVLALGGGLVWAAMQP